MANNTKVITPRFKREKFSLYQFIEYFYSMIYSIRQIFSRIIVKTAETVFPAIRRIALFIFDRILDIAELIYTVLLDPLRKRFGYLFRGILMVFKNKPIGIMLFVVISSYLSRLFLMYESRRIMVFSLVPFVLLLAFFFPIAGLVFYLFFGLGMLHKMIWKFPRMYTGTPLILAAMGAYTLRVLIGKEKEFSWVHDNQNLIVLALWSILTLSHYAGWSVTYYYLGFVTWFVVYYLAIQIIGRDKRRFLIFVAALSFVYAMYAFQTVRNAFYYGTQTEYTVTSETKGRLSDNNEMSAALNMALPLMVGFGIYTPNLLLKGAFLGTALIDIGAIVYANSRGGLIGLAVLALPLFFKLIFINKKIRTIGTVAILIISITGYSIFHEKVGKRVQSIINWKQSGSAKNRIMGFLVGMRAMADRPLYGIGSGMMVRAFNKYCPEVLVFRYWFGPDGTITLYRPKAERQEEGGTIGVEIHNAYGAVGGENGVFVFVLWVFLSIYSISKLRALRRTLPKTPENEWAHIFSHALELSILSYMLTSSLLNNFNDGFIYMVHAASLSLRHVAFKRKGRMEIVSFAWALLLIGIWTYYTFYIRFFVYSF